LFLENKFIYTDLKDCGFSWRAVKTEIGNTEENVMGSGILTSPEAEPGETVALKIDCGEALQEADLFLFKAIDPHGHELFTWSWPVIQPDEKAVEIANYPVDSGILVSETTYAITAAGNDIEITFSKENGTLLAIKNSNGNISLNGGPVPAGVDSKITGTTWGKDAEGHFIFEIKTDNYPEKMTWKLHKNGLLKLEACPLKKWLSDISFIGISFNYPEEKCEGLKWMGRGPFRVWKNRLKGSNFGVYEKSYNNTITGESFNNLVYPEFKGYHGNLYWATLETTESDFTIVSETPNLFFQLFKPGKPEHVAGGTHPPFPEGDLSFLYEIPAIGTKFKQAEKLGPDSQKGVYGGHTGDQNYQIKLWFDFRTE
jgi:hypothetical protein